MKAGKSEREEYIKKRKEYKEWCDKERERHAKEEEEKTRLIKTEEEAWKFINKYRKKKERIDENIGMENWSRYFIDLLEGTKERKVMEDGEEERIEEREREKEGDEEQEISVEEVVKHLKKLKKGKAPGENGIENEAWRLMPKEIGDVLYKLINKI